MIEKLHFDNGEEINMEVWERMLYKMNNALILCESHFEMGRYTDWNDMFDYLVDFMEELQIFNALSKEQEFYVLTMDETYGQPTGNVERVTMTPYKAYEYSKQHGYIYDDYAQAMAHAMD